MPTRDPLRLLAEATGESLMAVEESRLTMDAREREAPTAPSAIAVLQLHGPLSNRGIRFFGMLLRPGMDTFRNQLAQAVANPDVAAIVLDVDSPGGPVAGTPETANAVRAAAAVKPVIAVVDSMAASAAYYIISQASEIVATPSAEVGSIGVLWVHMDFSAQLEQEGVKVTIVRSRPGKAEMNPYEPLTAEAEAHMNTMVADADAEFLRSVAQGRNVPVAKVRDEFGQGRMVTAKAAKAAGMVDRIATMSEVLSGLIKTRAPAKRRSAFVFD